MELTRRRFVATAAAATALTPMRVWSASTLIMGDVQIDTLDDGYLSLPGSFALGDIPVEEAKPILDTAVYRWGDVGSAYFLQYVTAGFGLGLQALVALPMMVLDFLIF